MIPDPKWPLIEKDPEKKKQPQQLQTYNVPTDDVENSNNTN